VTPAIRIAESHLEDHTLAWLRDLGYTTLFGPDIAPGEARAERDDWHEVILKKRLAAAIARLNPDIPTDAQEAALRKILHPDSPSLVGNNRVFHRMLVDGVEVEYRRPDGSIRGDQVRLADFDHQEKNDWLAINQFTIIENHNNRRPDILLFLNGIPVVIIELKNPADEKATVETAFRQIQTYKQQIPSLFTYNEMAVISDGLDARIGTFTSIRERFMPWRTIEGDKLAPDTMLRLEVLAKGVFEKQRLLDLIRNYIVFEIDEDGSVAKKMAGYHQYHAVKNAVESTVKASRPGGDRRGGVVWHTQGSGKSLTMVFFTGEIVLCPAMENPTVVVITDRNDLDDQLFGTFSRCHEILRQEPVQAADREDLKRLLAVGSGGIVFTTIQKFFPEKKGGKYPELSSRKNIIVITDEAHRSQYDFIDGFARHIRDALPGATFIGFTGTPIEKEDRNTKQVFGDYISIYDIQRAVEDKATVPIYYESRLAKIDLDEAERPKIDPRFEEITEGEEIEQKEALKSKWAALEAVVGTEKRISLIAQDIVDHYGKRQTGIDGKAMIVCMSRRICVELYNAIVKIRPDWHADEDEKGALKIVMTGSATDEETWQPHIRNKPRREILAKRFQKSASDDPLRIVIVRDMWLTGFDVPSLHTMYVDKPMQGHTLMQAIARVNRVFKDKPGGLVVDYIGLGEELKKAIADYTESGGTGKTAIDQEEAVAVMLEKYEICCGIFHGFDWSDWEDPERRIALLPVAQSVILQKRDGKKRFVATVTELSRAFALSVPHEEAIRIRDDVAFFQAVRAALVKYDLDGDRAGKTWDMEHAIRQIVSGAIVSDQVIDIFTAAGLKKPDISILSEEFLAEVRGLPQKNVAVELLRKLLNDEIRTRQKKRLVQSRSFEQMLNETIHRYKNRAVGTVEVIEELIRLAKELREADRRGEDLGLTEAELAFYEALEVNDSSVKILGDEVLRKIAHELVEQIRKNVTIDWTVKESVKAKIRVMVKRILTKYNYPPDKQPKAVVTILEQAEILCAEISG
jgi:type I site-specific deoxyribonuclease, HsdR family